MKFQNIRLGAKLWLSLIAAALSASLLLARTISP